MTVLIIPNEYTKSTHNTVTKLKREVKYELEKCKQRQNLHQFQPSKQVAEDERRYYNQLRLKTPMWY